MRDIKDIWDELVSHPDFVYGEYYTKRDALENIMDYWFDSDESDDVFDGDLSWDDRQKVTDIVYNHLTKNDIIEIEKEIATFYENVMEWSEVINYPELSELECYKPVIRELKINNLLNGETL